MKFIEILLKHLIALVKDFFYSKVNLNFFLFKITWVLPSDHHEESEGILNFLNFYVEILLVVDISKNIE